MATDVSVIGSFVQGADLLTGPGCEAVSEQAASPLHGPPVQGRRLDDEGDARQGVHQCRGECVKRHRAVRTVILQLGQHP